MERTVTVFRAVLDLHAGNALRELAAQLGQGVFCPDKALGAAGAAIGMAERLVAGGLANAHDVAVFTAMCMCWSGYLSTHVAMMDALKSSHLTGKAILSHTIGGLVAGISANLIFQLIAMLG